MDRNTEALTLVIEHYLQDDQFLGYPATALLHLWGDVAQCRKALSQLVTGQLLTVTVADGQANVLVRALPAPAVAEQVRTMMSRPLARITLFPSPALLREVVEEEHLTDRPFTLALAQGEAQLAHRFFDVAVLERYHQHADYRVSTSDRLGTIWRKHAGQERQWLPAFGFACKANGERALTVTFAYLSRFDADTQAHWAAHQSEDPDYRVDEEDLRLQQLGEWPRKLTIVETILTEMQVLNDLAALMGRAPLWRSAPKRAEGPPGLARLVRPTAHSFAAFITAMDDLLSQNLNVDFFGDDRLWLQPDADEDETQSAKKTALHMLAAWLGHRFRTSEQGPIQDMLASLRDLHRCRCSLSDNADDTHFDTQLFVEQQRWFTRCDEALRVLRLIFANHPAAAEYELPPELEVVPVLSEAS